MCVHVRAPTQIDAFDDAARARRLGQVVKHRHDAQLARPAHENNGLGRGRWRGLAISGAGAGAQAGDWHGFVHNQPHDVRRVEFRNQDTAVLENTYTAVATTIIFSTREVRLCVCKMLSGVEPHRAQ